MGIGGCRGRRRRPPGGYLTVATPHDARFVGARKNTFALRRASAIVNLQTIGRMPTKVAA
jgi:hypothetical protein